MAAPTSVWVLAEGQPGKWPEVTLEMLADARAYADRSGEPVWAIVCGESFPAGESWADELAHHGADRVVALHHPLLATYATEPYVLALTGLAAQTPPSLVVLAAGRSGQDLAPRLTVRLGGIAATGCISFRWLDGGALEAVRPAWADKGQITLHLPSGRPRVVTLRPGVAGVAKPNPGRQAPLERVPAAIAEEQVRVRPVQFIPADPRTIDITEADRIVAGGRGAGGPEGFALLGELAVLLEAAIAASRVAVDLGWVPYERQVGQTGRKVRPRLYLACGISGASQHVMGMQDSDVIIAVNKDKAANIFKLAQLGIVGDVQDVIPALIRKLRQGPAGTEAPGQAPPAPAPAHARQAAAGAPAAAPAARPAGLPAPAGRPPGGPFPPAAPPRPAASPTPAVSATTPGGSPKEAP